ncbi:GNAT family N-acetyltransferase [Luteimonas sp. Y-2-2-4F]|nr:GNAT family N-acetyltransferase [Luteimonas sp. Y-2-2-4F]MCD9031994.1 GNAT family N-acetyltransferase [Luteimonas sp. Y-2-2-4F]
MLAVRGEVFVAEQGVPESLERDDRDAHSVHVLARDAAGAPIGAARLAPGRRIGRMAVLRAWRGRGVGDALLDALLDEARAQGLAEVSLHAQAPAIGFYARHGFLPEGERFEEAGIAHQAMRRALAGPQAVETREDAVAVVAALVRGARRRLRIYSRDLDPGLFDAPPVLAALRRFATAGGAEARILLQSPEAPQRAHAPLLALAQRLPSAFAFRAVEDPVDRAYAAAFAASERGCYFRGLGHRFDGEAELDGAGRARQLAAAFDTVWERARPCSEYRALAW